MKISVRRFIPFRKRDIVEMLLQKQPYDDDARFRQFCEILQSVFHFDYHRRLEDLKDAYAPLNPDRDTRAPVGIAEASSADFARQMESLLERANYDRLTDADLQRAFEENSLFKLQLHVDFDDFEEVLLFTRGEYQKQETVSQLFGLWAQSVSFSNFDRVVIYVKLKADASLQQRPDRTGITMLKLFQNVPKADIEMLFPNTRLGMRMIDKLIIGVPALAGGVVALSTKIGASMILLGALVGYWLGLSAEPVELSRATALALIAGIAGLGSFIWKQFSNFKNRKLRFLQSLTENLYFKNLDNNAGVFHRLVDDAEEEECKEAILAYSFLLRSEQPLTRQQLDAAIEQWLQDQWDCTIDFEIDDALDKLRKLGLVSGEQTLLALPLVEACEALDQRWDNYFTETDYL
ncbi:DUF3754 domain-containing protein [Halieaceae bacterium IMCC14734]|uniref:DUF3754 domain-containing protein n=1 Tax=Candidatus Litorirhabdus singularis TaxID=2518993 RepID=A0ABT3TEJ1_9GAMM|nr:TMEM143 family protein [Candidatus Litorirhabdus singularis]MCX2980728.1 DUF3754 domain-containing protein [Candidatus Litorirhabdus singularis]